MSKSWEKGSTWKWRKIRAQVLARDGHMCRLKIPGEWMTKSGHLAHCLITATQVHHEQGRSVTGDDPNHCVAACAPCNQYVGDPTDKPDPEPTLVIRW